MHAMAEWYMRGEPHDQSRLSRILDVAQDLKVSVVLYIIVVTTIRHYSYWWVEIIMFSALHNIVTYVYVTYRRFPCY